MKKIIAFMLSLALVFLLCACGEQPKGIDESTAGATDNSAIATDTGETTLSTEEQDTPAILTPEEEFLEILRSNKWYGRAMACTFEKPEDISARFYFYLGVDDNTQATGEELAFILDAFKKKNPNNDQNYAYNYIRLPVVKLNEALSILGVTIDDLQIPDRWVYSDKTDAYYFWVSDAFGLVGETITKVEKDAEGTMTVYWEKKDSLLNTATGEYMKNAKMVMTLQQQSDGTYRVLSNLPQE